MQGSSFWKTVAIVGVIGIGSLAILEVQNRLPKQNAGEPTEEDLATLVAGPGAGDSTVTPEMSDSEFDKMMAAAQSDTPLFNGAEPAAEPTPSPSLDAQFFNSEPVAAQTNTPPVDTDVQTSQLAQGPNPFEDMGAVTAVAANYQGEPSNAVEPVAFTGEESFPGDSSNDDTGYRREGVAAPEPAVSPAADFSLFPSDSPADQDAGNMPAMPLADDRPPAAIPSRTDAIEFFNGKEADPVDTAPRTTQFYENNESQLQSVPETQPSNPFPDPGQLNQTPESAAPMDSQSNGILPFQNSDGRTQDGPPSDNVTETFRGDLLSPQDRVPQPRDIQPGIIPEPEFPTFDERSFPEPERASPVPDTSLPPIDDTGGLTSEPFRVPDINDSGRMTIPDTETPRFDDRGRSEELRPFDPLPSRESSPPAPDFGERSRFEEEPRSFESERNFRSDSRGIETPGFNDDSRGLSIEPRFNPNSRDLNDTQPFNDDRMNLDDSRRTDSLPPLNERLRERDDSRPLDELQPFNDGSRDFSSTPDFSNRRNRNGQDNFPSTPEITPRRRDFDSGPSMGDTRPADFNFSDHSERERIRQVSGVMRPNLLLEKTAPESATVGVPLDYKIYVRNEGDASAFDVVVEDEISPGTEIDGARPQPDRDRSTNRLIWKFAEIAPNQTEEITVRLTPTGEGTLDGVATVKFKSRVKATTIITAPKLRIEMTGPEEVKLGDEVAYRYVITNEGSGEARDVLVRTVLPADGGLKHPQGRDLEYEIGNMAAGQQREIVLAVVAGEPGEYRADAIVSGTGGVKDQAAWRTNIIGAQLQIVRRGPKRRFVGKSATYENIVSNETNFDALDARIVETIPEGMRFKGANKGGTYDEQQQTVTWRINRLGPGRQEQLQIQLMPTDAGQRESIVTVYENAGLQSENYVSTTVVEDLHNVGAQMSQLDGPVPVGETFGFTITIDNRGTADATDVELVVDVPRQIEVLGAGSKTNQAKLTGNNQVQYSQIIRIKPNERQTFELKLRGTSPVRNKVVTAKVRYRQMEDPLIVGESVTIYSEEL